MQNIPDVVSAQWLYQHLEQQVIIVDCRFSLADAQLGQQQYQKSHIIGAYYLDLNRHLSGPVEKHGGRHPLPDPTELAKTLSAMGITSETLVVAYDDSRFAFAARLWWLLRYLGHPHVAILDGGFAAWQNAGYPVTDAIAPPQIVTFIPQLHTEWVVDLPYVKNCQNSSEVVLIDSRESDRFRGEREPIDKIAGHIPGAVNYPWQEVTDELGNIRSPEEHEERWQNIAPEQEILVYCGSGVTACVNLLSLKVAGIHGKLYAGSWSDWCSYL